MRYSVFTVERIKLLGAAVRSVRQSRGWTQADLGKRLGIGVVTVGKIEAGSTGIAYGTILELCSMLNLSPEPERIASTPAQIRSLLGNSNGRSRVRRQRPDPALDV